MEPDSIEKYSLPIVVCVCEGPTDIPYLKQPLYSHFMSIYGSDCKIVSLGGDLTSDYLIPDEKFLELNSIFIQTELESPKNKIDVNIAKNIKEVVQIIDIDNAFIDESCVTEDGEKESFYYTRSGISYKNKKVVIDRNKLKTERIEKLLNMSTINLFGIDIPYSLYFYSINIDDFHNKNALNISEEIKGRLATQFERRYILIAKKEDKVKFFLSLFKKVNPADFPDGIKESWKYVKDENRCLSKCSNVYLVVEKEKR